VLPQGATTARADEATRAARAIGRRHAGRTRCGLSR
jgi:hypothetical protein